MIDLIATTVGYVVISAIFIAGIFHVVKIRLNGHVYGLSFFGFGVFVFQANDTFMQNAGNAGYLVRNLHGEWRIGIDLPIWLYKRIKPKRTAEEVADAMDRAAEEMRK